MAEIPTSLPIPALGAWRINADSLRYPPKRDRDHGVGGSPNACWLEQKRRGDRVASRRSIHAEATDERRGRSRERWNEMAAWRKEPRRDRRARRPDRDLVR